MKTHHLRCFIEVVEKGSMRSAAERLGVSAAAVSQALRELERDIGAPLLKRHSQGVSPTSEGHRLLTHARLIIAHVDRAQTEIDEIRGMRGGTISIGVTPWVTQAILPSALAEFQRLRPGVRLDVHESVGTAHTDLRNGTIDLAIGLAPSQQLSAGFISRDLFSCGLAVIGRVDHPRRNSTSLRDLADQSWAMTVPDDAYFQRHTELLESVGIAYNSANVHMARSGFIVLSMLEGSDMLTICPWPLVESPLMRDRVAALPIQDPMPDMVTSLVVRRADTLSVTAQAFLDGFLATARQCHDSVVPSIRRMMNSVELLDAQN
ncbi:LysR family transcriptional regulator [Ralstonia pickettii]|uniref:LysR family transcriptional regulator n=1 Tax=Ralstonia pickettii TaxID=329 RepID=A0A7X2HLT7_RALPI|nr:LysR family transcriptional regulator [Ralstonia pickettii]MRS98893.1 LysR family transcriptional regulator [Ralstonia pickettii]